MIGSMVVLRLTNLARFMLGACIFVAITFLYQIDTPVLVATTGVLTAAVSMLLRDKLATVLLVAAAIHIITTLFLSNLERTRTIHTGYRAADAARSSSVNLQPLLHLVMDEFSGLHGLPTDIKETKDLAADLAIRYPIKGFDIYSHAYSQYFQTNHSLPNLFNFSSSDKMRAYSEGSKGNFRMSANKYFSHLLDLGYALNVYQSSYLDFCDTPSVPIMSCFSYDENSIESIADIKIPYIEKSKFILNSYLDSSGFLRKVRTAYIRAGRKLGISLPRWPSGNSYTGPLAVMPTLNTLESALRDLKPGEAHFAHLMLPHYPYNLNSDCTLKPRISSWLNRAPFSVEGRLVAQNSTTSRRERYQMYSSQVECTQFIIEKLFSAITESGLWQSAIIIIHGDHGSRIVRRVPGAFHIDALVPDDFRDAYSTFFAVKNGDASGQLDSTVIPLQTLLAKVWQLPEPYIDPDQVYVDSAGQSTLLAIPLQGFERAQDD